jgi:hypothetical protein
MPNYFDRYSFYRENNTITTVPGIIIPEDSNDKFAIYKQGLSRLDKLSDVYYNNPYSGWLIMLANPQYGGLEFTIPNLSKIRIPFPYDNAIKKYITAIKNNKNLYG